MKDDHGVSTPDRFWANAIDILGRRYERSTSVIEETDMPLERDTVGVRISRCTARVIGRITDPSKTGTYGGV